MNRKKENAKKAKDPVVFRMGASIRFNREIDPEKDYLSPGGYEFTMDGRKTRFDFAEYSAYVDGKNRRILHMECKNPDYEYEDTAHITKEMLGNVTEINEFFVFTGEAGESDLEPEQLLACYFTLIHTDDPQDEWLTLEVPQKVIKEACMINYS